MTATYWFYEDLTVRITGVTTLDVGDWSMMDGDWLSINLLFNPLSIG